MVADNNGVLTVCQKTLQGFLDVEFGVEDYKPEANRKNIIAGASFEEGANAGDSLIVLTGRLDMRASASSRVFVL